jgi:integrase
MEAYYLEWGDINFDKGEICICAKDHWKPKDKEFRYIPICKELSEILLEAFHNAPEGAIRVCPETNPQNIDRAIAWTVKRAGLKLWKKPLNSLRKSCIQDWSETYPLTDVMAWAGHSSMDTTQRYYTQENKENRKRAASRTLWISTENSTENQKQDSPKESAEIQDNAK